MSESDLKPSVSDYIVAVLSFFPFLGVILAPVSLALGFVKKKNNGGVLIAIGICGLAINLAFIPHFRNFESQDYLNSLVKEIEYYKLVHKNYPSTLQELVDSGQVRKSHIKGKNSREFSYILNSDGSTYFLYDESNGFVPNIPQYQLSSIGYRPKPASTTISK